MITGFAEKKAPEISLFMCMGFGCNAAGVTGCRIIDSPRERLLAILTNSLVPCNGRFPALIALIGMFFVAPNARAAGLRSALLLTGLILFSICITFAATWLLSATLLRGKPSAFTLELPPYRPPQIGQVLIRSVLDRTVFVLGRAALVAAPAGALLWLLSNLQLGGTSLLLRCAAALEPVGKAMGLDGVILFAFVLGLPANEIVLPIIVMAYTSQSTLTELQALGEVRGILLANGWTLCTAVCMTVFLLLHWPCSTTLLTVHRETGSWRDTALAAAVPTLLGALLCILIRCVWLLFASI